MSVAGRKSDLKNHLSRRIKKNIASLIPTTQPENTGAVRDETASNVNTSIAGIDRDQRPSSQGVIRA